MVLYLWIWTYQLKANIKNMSTLNLIKKNKKKINLKKLSYKIRVLYNFKL